MYKERHIYIYIHVYIKSFKENEEEKRREEKRHSPREDIAHLLRGGSKRVADTTHVEVARGLRLRTAAFLGLAWLGIVG